MPYFLSPIGNAQTIDANGDPLVGGTISTFLAGTTTPETTYTDDTGGTPQGVVMTLNSLGYPKNGPVWLLGGVPLKFIIKNALGVTQSTFDDISGIGDTSTVADQWVLYGAAPTYISATSFSLVGDQTNAFQVNRRLKSVNSGGTVYSTISASSFGSVVTTVTVVNDSGVLDIGLSQVNYSLLTPLNPSVPTTYAKSGANGDITSLSALTALSSLPPMTVFGGAVTRMAAGTGLNANVLATTIPIRLSFPGGIGATGRVDHPGSITADASAFWASLTASSTLYTFYDRNTSTGVITGVFSTLPYISQDSGVAVSVVSGQHTFVTDTNTMYVGNGSTAAVVQRIPEGELVTDVSAVTSVTSYAKLRRFTGAWVATLPAASTQVSANHNLGTQEFIGQFEAECTTDDVGFSVGDRVDLLVAGLAGTNVYPMGIRKRRLSVSIQTAGGSSQPFLIPDGTTGNGTALTHASWKYRFVCLPKF